MSHEKMSSLKSKRYLTKTGGVHTFQLYTVCNPINTEFLVIHHRMFISG